MVREDVRQTSPTARPAGCGPFAFRTTASVPRSFAVSCHAALVNWRGGAPFPRNGKTPWSGEKYAHKNKNASAGL